MATRMVCALAFGVVACSAAAQEVGRIAFKSFTPPAIPTEMARLGRNAPAAEVSGHLQLPRGAAGKVPAMVLLHSSGGVSERNLSMWEDKFLAMGIATFKVDSLGGRGLTSANQTHRHAQLADAYEALKLLAAHPAIDGQRIAVIGFSLGGIGAMEAPMEDFRQLFGVGEARFAAHFSLYPTCNFRVLGSKVRPEPVVVFVPEKEDWTVPAYCEKYVDALKAGGGNARVVMLTGAYHGFDQLGRNQYKTAYANPGTCEIELSLTRGMRRADRGEPLLSTEAFGRYMSTCRGTQASLVGDSTVLARVETEIKDVLSSAFNMPLK